MPSSIYTLTICGFRHPLGAFLERIPCGWGNNCISVYLDLLFYTHNVHKKSIRSILHKNITMHVITGHRLVHVCCVCLVAQWCLTLCDPMDCYPPGSSVHGDSPGKNTAVGCHALLRGSPRPRDQTQVSRIAGRFSAV